MQASRGISVLGTRENYLLGIYIRDLAVGTLRLAVELFLAGWLYRCGPKVSRFLLGDAGDSRV
jgi:hypothetical protein